MPCPPRMRGCKANCLHRMMVESYQDTRLAAEAEREDVAIGYAGDEALYQDRHPMPTFKRWLTRGGWDAFRAPEPPDEV